MSSAASRQCHHPSRRTYLGSPTTSSNVFAKRVVMAGGGSRDTRQEGHEGQERVLVRFAAVLSALRGDPLSARAGMLSPIRCSQPLASSSSSLPVVPYQSRATAVASANDAAAVAEARAATASALARPRFRFDPDRVNLAEYEFDGLSTVDDFMPPPLPETTFADAFTSPTSRGTHRPHAAIIGRGERRSPHRQPSELSEPVRAHPGVPRFVAPMISLCVVTWRG